MYNTLTHTEDRIFILNTDSVQRDYSIVSFCKGRTVIHCEEIYNSPKGLGMCVVPTVYQAAAEARMTLSWLSEGRGHFLEMTNIWRSTNREQGPCWENAGALSLSCCVTQTHTATPCGVCWCVCMEVCVLAHVWVCLCLRVCALLFMCVMCTHK